MLKSNKVNLSLPILPKTIGPLEDFQAPSPLWVGLDVKIIEGPGYPESFWDSGVFATAKKKDAKGAVEK